MTVKTINVYFSESVLISNQPLDFTLGYIDTDNSLSPLSNASPDLEIILIEPVDGRLIDNQTFLLKSSISTITLRFKIIYQGYTQYYSYAVAAPLPAINKNDLLNRFKVLLPQGVYDLSIGSNNMVDTQAAASILDELYNSDDYNKTGFYSISQLYNKIFPESGADGWEYFLTGKNRLLYQSATQYGALLQHIYACEINNNTNPYWLAFNISKYIYLWLNKQRFVYIQENVYSLSNAFIINQNILGQCMFLGSNIDAPITFYILTDNPDGTPMLTADEQAQITLFINQITRSGINFNINYISSSISLGLFYLGNTYFTDPRQGKSYCIAYNQNVLSEALGYTGNMDYFAVTSITDINLTPSDGAILNTSSTYPITLTTIPAWSGTNIPLQYTQFYITSPDGGGAYTIFDGTNISLYTGTATGTITLKIYIGLITKQYSYTII